MLDDFKILTQAAELALAPLQALFFHGERAPLAETPKLQQVADQENLGLASALSMQCLIQTGPLL